ncbi:tripartite tricarboxylate transporter permease [Microbacterium karelineae]|uniref:tripartite tricarboxylate transporter permease n=1 Tax=Microbacterium karelineae TaxID=2654283 RepID=UPI0012EA9C5E|nr:tripartite tricarboxylate transporter permease [Microbacterium karelineae]
MDQLISLGDGFAVAFAPSNLLFLVIGAILGTAVGVLPGLGSAMAVALLLPVTFSLDPTGAFIMFASIYFGGLFGDSTAGILLNTPGNSSAIATSFEGHRMAKSGQAAKALGTAAIGAFVGGTIACTLVVFFSPFIADLARVFGPAEYFALTVVAFVAISSVVADSIVRGLVALGLGFAISLVGIDGVSGAERFTGGIPQVFDGVSIIVLTVGLLALGEVLHVGAYIRTGGGPGKIIDSKGSPFLGRSDWRKVIPAFLRGTSFGVPFGVIPVGGSEVPTFLAYGTEKRLARRRKDPDFGGRGAIQGVAAPEAAGNATAGTAMGALLALGIPTSATAAMMIAAFQQYGMQPGPLLFERNADLVWPLLASFFVGLVILLIINLPFAAVWAKLLLVPRHYLYAGITVLAMLGVYAVASRTFDMWVALGIGVVGFIMRRFSIPIAPVLIAAILGPVAEVQLRRALAISEGDPVALVASPLPIVLYVLLAIVVVFSGVRHLQAAQAKRREAAAIR